MATQSRLRHAALIAALVTLLWPVRAAAHLVTTGMGPVYDGIGHLLLTPEDLVPVFALSLFVGLRGPESGRRALFLLPVAWLAGGLLGTAMGSEPVFPVAACSFLLLGGVVAADLRLSARTITVLVMGLGLVHGALNGIALRSGPGVIGLLGIAAALFVLVALVAAVAVSLKPNWTRIAVRVAGSWVVAVGVLMLGWNMAGVG